MSESFANDASDGTGHFPKDGSAATTSAALGTVAISFDAATGNYTLSATGLSQTFRPSDLISENAQTKTFRRISGSTTDELLLTKSGTSGAFTYRYVGGALLQRTVDSANSVDGRVLALAYGVPSLVSQVPRTGVAGYSMDLIANNGQVAYVGSDGTLNLDFAGGLFSGSVGTTIVTPGGPGGAGPTFTTSGTISSTGNSLAGTVRTDDINAYRATLAGRFYGPAGEELGATFYGASNLGNALVGFILGRRGVATANLSLTNLAASQAFSGSYVEHSYNRSGTGSTYVGGENGSRATSSLNYDAANKSWTYNTQLGNFVFTDAQKTGATGRYIVYDDANRHRLLIYRPGPDNPDLVLSYASFAMLETTVNNPDGNVLTRFRMLPFGIVSASKPLTGTSNYSGALYGKGISTASAYDLTGTAALAINFATGGSVTGTLHPSGRDLINGRVVDFGSFAFNGGVIESGGKLVYSGIGGGPVGFMDGFLFGPNAEEFASTFGLTKGTDPNFAGVQVDLSGVVVARKN